jgi:NAD(P)H dehydrogenase (quinone)
MSKIAIVYFSGSGHTHLMAEAIAAGVRSADGQAKLLRITGDQMRDGRWLDEDLIERLDDVDGIVFGSPTYMGGVAAQFKAFLDAMSSVWMAQRWKDKIAAGFTHSSCLSGDKQGTLLYLATNAAQHAMIWVGTGDLPSHYIGQTDGVNRLGSFLGVMGQSPMAMPGGTPQLDPGDRLTAEKFGQRITEIANRMTAVQV